MRTRSLLLCAGAALLLAAAPGQAQTYQDYANGSAYVMAAPAGGYVTTPVQGPTYQDYANGRAFALSVPTADRVKITVERVPTYEDYANGRAYVTTSLVDDSTGPRARGYGFEPVYVVPIPYPVYAGQRFAPGWPPPPPSITTTIARSRFLPSAAVRLSTTPKMYSHTPSPYDRR
jgi:hypothetical protein